MRNTMKKPLTSTTILLSIVRYWSEANLPLNELPNFLEALADDLLALDE